MRNLRNCFKVSAVALPLAWGWGANAATFFLGDEVTAARVDVDAFGRVLDSTYDPLGSTGSLRPKIDAFIAIGFGGPRLSLGDAVYAEGGEATEVSASDTSMETTFSIGALNLSLFQDFQNYTAYTADDGATLLALSYDLAQTLSVTNTGQTALSFDLVGYSRTFRPLLPNEEVEQGTIESIAPGLFFSGGDTVAFDFYVSDGDFLRNAVLDGEPLDGGSDNFPASTIEAAITLGLTLGAGATSVPSLTFATDFP